MVASTFDFPNFLSCMMCLCSLLDLHKVGPHDQAAICNWWLGCFEVISRINVLSILFISKCISVRISWYPNGGMEFGIFICFFLFIYRVTLLLNTNILLFSKSSNNKNYNLLIKKTYIQSTIIIKYDFSFHTFPCFFYYFESYQQKTLFN
jgi:hypothetical protein